MSPSGQYAAPPSSAVDFGIVWAPGVRMFQHLRFRAKALIVSALLSLPLLALLGFQSRHNADVAMQVRQGTIRDDVDVALAIVQQAYRLETSGALPRAKAQALAQESLRKVRYGGTEYFFIFDMQPRMVMHPLKPELQGQDLSNFKDPNGFRLFSAMAEVVRKDGKGFVAYQWPKPGKDQPVDKVSYAAGFEPWGWVIATGLYVDDLREAMLKTLLLGVGVAAAVLLVAGYFFVCFYRVMDAGLKETRRHLRAMTEGDLTTAPTPRGTDETAELLGELVEMQTFLRGMVTTVRRSSNALLHSSTKIAGDAQDLSTRTEKTASNLEQSAAAMEQISATVKGTSQHVVDATAMARHNASVAADGGQAMQAVVGTMQAIRESSTKIADIIGTIDGIAFQTNILALNAAVEAARAAEHGRGFAVVASEVRSLSQRSAEAAKQIKTLIASSETLIESGTTVVARAGDTISQIVASSDRVRQLLTEVASGAAEQTTGVARVETAIVDLDRMTQENSGMVGQTVVASGELMQEAQALADHVRRFRLVGDPAGVAA